MKNTSISISDPVHEAALSLISDTLRRTDPRATFSSYVERLVIADLNAKGIDPFADQAALTAGAAQ